jgi:CrcB protein
MNKILSVAAGGGMGAVARYLVQNWALGKWGAAFPYGTLLVNITGAFGIGFIMTLFLNHLHISPSWRVFVVTGILGGYTTFSALAWETYALFAKGDILHSLLYTGASFLGGMAALGLGVWLGNFI